MQKLKQSEIEKDLILTKLKRLFELISSGEKMSAISNEFKVSEGNVIVNPFGSLSISIPITDFDGNLANEYVEDTLKLVEKEYKYKDDKPAAKKTTEKTLKLPNTNNAHAKALQFGSLAFCENVYNHSLENIETAKSNGMSSEYIETLEGYSSYYGLILRYAKQIDFEVEKNDFLQNLPYNFSVLGYGFSRREILNLFNAAGIECNDYDTAVDLCFKHIVETHFLTLECMVEYFETLLYQRKCAILRYCKKSSTVKSYTIKKLNGSDYLRAQSINNEIIKFEGFLKEIKNLS